MLQNVRFAFLLVMIISPVVIFSQEINRKITDQRLNKEILYGYCDRSGLQEGDFGEAFSEYYRNYKPDKAVIRQLRKLDKDADITIVLGTWCSDAEKQVPRFLKILDRIKFNKQRITMICVDRDKKVEGIDIQKLDIQRIPTFIVYVKGREAGRIIEKPYLSLERDLLMFLSD
ncbi:MAG: thioredoxin family protein [Bacteroidales bacterium]|jgi:hypothetical protein